MKRKVAWLVVTGWMVAALLLASCAPAVVKEAAEKVAPREKVVPKEGVVTPKEEVVPKEAERFVKWTGKKLDGTVVEKMIEKPTYGGLYISARQTAPTNFDDAKVANAWASGATNEELLEKDWTRGPFGTEEWAANLNTPVPVGIETGWLAESWEKPDNETLIFHIRKGVRWALDPASEASRLIGGRQFTAADVVHSLRRDFSPGNYAFGRGPLLSDMKDNKNSIYVSPTDKWAVVLKSQPGGLGALWQTAGTRSQIQPPEVIEKYGHMDDWKNVVGTGPFILKEYVGASSLTYVRNPNYWRHDPFFPENQLPYIDSFKVLIIPDMSTLQAGVRTGKIDALDGLTWEQSMQVLKTNPELKYVTAKGVNGPTIHMRQDEPELPTYDVRVRRALYMAINKQEILDTFYSGKGEILNFPLPPLPENMDIYIPVKELPESIRVLYEYHPDKAKQLLAEAGYPNGFSAEVLVPSASQDLIDIAQIIKNYWTKIGVDLKIDVRDSTVVTSLTRARRHKDMVIADLLAVNPFNFTYTRKGSAGNLGNLSDPKIVEMYEAVSEAFFDTARQRQLMKSFLPYIYENVQVLAMPFPSTYTIWQPWLKGFQGVDVGSHNTGYHPTYLWIDRELKKAMGR